MNELPICHECGDEMKTYVAHRNGFEMGKEIERKRIIKLLEAEMERIRLMTNYPATNALANVRATLIKGENK